MARNLREVLRQLADELDTEERSETLEARLQALEEREAAGGTITTGQIIAALESASDEELEALHGTVVDRLAREVEERREAAGGDEPPAPAPPPDDDENNLDPIVPKTRPGRKQGSAYDWDIDADGKIVRLRVARVWNEPDEDDEVPVAEPEVEEEETP